MTNKTELPFHNDLYCFVRRVEYDFELRTGTLYMGDNSCTDMAGCIKLFKAIDPSVQLILTFAGMKPDTAYHRIGKGDWDAVIAENVPICFDLQLIASYRQTTTGAD